MTWAKVILAALALAREFIKYLREHKKCSQAEQLAELAKATQTIQKARERKKYLRLNV